MLQFSNIVEFLTEMPLTQIRFLLFSFNFLEENLLCC